VRKEAVRKEAVEKVVREIAAEVKRLTSLEQFLRAFRETLVGGRLREFSALPGRVQHLIRRRLRDALNDEETRLRWTVLVRAISPGADYTRVRATMAAAVGFKVLYDLAEAGLNRPGEAS